MAPRSLFRMLIFVLAVMATIVAVVSISAQEKDKTPKADAKAADKEKEREAPADRYAVPDGKSDALIEFITSLRQFRPSTQEEFDTHLEKMPKAVKAAVDKILAQEKDKKSDVAQKARKLLLENDVMFAFKADAKGQAAVLERVKEHVAAAGEDISVEHAQMALGISRALGTSDPNKAADAYEAFFKLFAKAKDKRIAALPEQMAPMLRRLKLPGNEMKIGGKTVEGKEFDWASYRGKVVLVDFWATWCGPCLAELPNVRTNYEKYHEKGFDVVGISLDQDKQKLESFLKDEKLPWVTLHEEGGMHPAAEFYGIESIPTVILVDKEGKVVSLNARGDALGELLTKLLGPAEKTEKAPAKKATK